MSSDKASSARRGFSFAFWKKKKPKEKSKEGISNERSNGKPKEDESERSNGKPKEEEYERSNGKPKEEESERSNGKPKEEEYEKSNGESKEEESEKELKKEPENKPLSSRIFDRVYSYTYICFYTNIEKSRYIIIVAIFVNHICN